MGIREFSGIGNSGDRLIRSEELDREILVPHPSPQQHLTRATASENASASASPELPLLCQNKKGAT
jgi:hypothetical protein